MDQKLPEKFTSFVRSYEGAEIIDELSLTPDQQAAQKADYFFNGRTIIDEQKSLEIDTAHKIEAILKPYEGTAEWPLFYGEQELQKIVNFLPNPEKINAKILEAVTDSIEGLFEKANRQIRTTKQTFGLPSSGGLLVILNDLVDVLSPDILAFRVRRCLQKRTKTGEPRFPEVTVVWAINTAHYTQLTPTLKAMPLLIMPSGLPDPNHVETFVGLLGERWSAFEGQPHLRTNAETLKNFKFSTFRDEANKSGSLPRHEVWRLQYRQNPHLRNLSKIELFKYGLRSSSEMEDMLCTESKEKLTPELMDEVGRKFTYFLEEMNFRGIDMREFEKFSG